MKDVDTTLENKQLREFKTLQIRYKKIANKQLFVKNNLFISR